MVVERAELPITPGQELAFEAAMIRGLEILSAADGCHSVTLARGIEHPSKYLLLLTWDAVSSHTALTKTDAFGEFRAILGPFLAGPTSMEHFQPVNGKTA